MSVKSLKEIHDSIQVDMQMKVYRNFVPCNFINFPIFSHFLISFIGGEVLAGRSGRDLTDNFYVNLMLTKCRKHLFASKVKVTTTPVCCCR